MQKRRSKKAGVRLQNISTTKDTKKNMVQDARYMIQKIKCLINNRSQNTGVRL